MKHCAKCVLPDTKPDLFFHEDGVCSACRAYEKRDQIDWKGRKDEFRNIAAKFKGRAKWDCIVPVSGGKDSTTQVLTLLAEGMRPLCVSARTCDLTPIGRRNLDNIANLGVDLIELNANRAIRQKLNKISLERVGDISWPEHLAIFTGPVKIAVSLGVPLIVWGENSQNEYGGPAASQDNSVLDRSWLEEFGGLLGQRVEDLINTDGFDKRDLEFYSYPTDKELKDVGVTGLFLGHYFPWDGLANAILATSYGFESWPSNTQGSMVNYENLDNYQAGIHEYFKYLKFGFGRASDHVSMHIRRGRLSRSMGVEIVNRLDGVLPANYLGQPLETTLSAIDVTMDEFYAYREAHVNEELFETDASGMVKYDDLGRPVLTQPLK